MTRVLLGVCLVAGLSMAMAPAAAAAPHGVRLTYYADPATTMAVSWNSDAADDVEITYGTSPTALTESATATVIDQPSPLNHTFTARLAGLAPGTTYYYRVAGYPAAGDPPLAFHTLSADPCAPHRFMLIGDNRQDFGDGANPTWGSILAETLAFDVDYYVNTGDMVLDGNTPAQWDSFIDMSEPGWAAIPSILTLGNHDDSDENGDGALYNQLYELPRHPGGTEDFYSIDIGPIHFVSLNSQYNDPGSPEMAAQVAFLDADLAATSQPWKVVFFHKAVYTRGNHRTGEEPEGDGAINAQFVPIFDEHHVDFVFNGHSHNYERYAPSRGVDTRFGGGGRTLPAGHGDQLPASVPDGETGTTYMVSGGAGALTTDILGFTCLDAACTFCTGFNINCDQAVFDMDKDATVVYEGKHNFAIFDVEGDTMNVEVRTTVAGNVGGGNVVDTFSMTKTDFDLQCGVTPVIDARPPTDDAGGGGDDVAPDAGGPGVDGGGGGCCRVGAGSPGVANLAIALFVGGLVRRRRGRAMGSSR